MDASVDATLALRLRNKWVREGRLPPGATAFDAAQAFADSIGGEMDQDYYILFDDATEEVWRKPDGIPFGTESERYAVLVRDVCAPECRVGRLGVSRNPLTRAPLWSQRDPRWAGEKLGFGTFTIGQYGCLVTAAAMGLTAVTGDQITPLDVNAQMKAANGFIGSTRNLFVFSKLPEAYPDFKLDLMVHCTTVPAPIAAIAQAVDRGDVVVVRIDMDLTDPDVDNHWLLLTGVDSERPIFEVHDPWPMPASQAKLNLPPAYCKQGWNAARAIYSVVSYTRHDDLIREG